MDRSPARRRRSAAWFAVHSPSHRQADMKLNQLRYFTVLAEDLHFRRASERLGITQAPLSLAIQELERELGGKLFHRTRRKVSLTEIGLLLQDNARAILARVDRTVADIRRVIDGDAGEL